MKELKIGKCYAARGFEDGVELGFSSVPGNTMDTYLYSRDGFEKLIEWGQAWLKENPEQIEGFINVYPSWCSHVAWTEEAAAKLDEETGINRIACIPISYHIGQGLEEENE